MASGGTLLVVASFVFISKNVLFPGAWVLLPVAGAMMLIAAGSDAWINRCVLGNRFLVWVGLISFPLYLWHWPLLSFATVIEGATPSLGIRLLSVCVTFFMAFFTFRYLEMPLRRYRERGANQARWLVWSLCILMSLLFLYGIFLQSRAGIPERTPGIADNVEFNRHPGNINNLPEENCDSRLPADARCIKSKMTNPSKVLIIGDSHGGALAPGLYRALTQLEFVRSDHSIIYLKTRGCLPLLGVETFNRLGGKTNCSALYQQIFDYGLGEKNVVAVILVARWAARVGRMEGFGQFDETFRGHVELVDKTNAVHDSPKSNSDVFGLGLRKTLTAMRVAGKKVIFVQQVPEFGFIPPFCGRRPMPLSHWSERDDRCSISREVVNTRQQEYRDLFETVRRDYPEVKVIDPLPLFCDRDSCSMRYGDTYLYRDHNHLNPDGAYLVGKMIVDELR